MMNIQPERKSISEMSKLDLAEFRYTWRKEEFDKRFQRAINRAYEKGYKSSQACAYAVGATDKFADHINLKLFEHLYSVEQLK